MAKTRRERCPHCGFLEVIKWGKQCGHQRYKCKKCGSLFTFRRKDISKANRFVWFEWWILRKQTIVILSITLSVFAILYTYTSNVQIQQQFEKINTAANNITIVSDKLTTTENKLNDNLVTILNRLESIDDRQEKISGQMNNLNTKLNYKDFNITNVPSNNIFEKAS